MARIPDMPPSTVKKPRWPKRNVDNFFDQWSPEMAYVLGYFAADGSMYINKRNSCYLGFYSSDLELITSVRKIMKVSNKIEIRKRRKPWKTSYVLQIGGKKLFDRVLELGFIPNKSLTLKFPDVPNTYLNHFVRGYFDGDGCAYLGLYKSKGRRKKFRKTLTIRFICGSREFLIELQKRLAPLCHVTIGSLHSHGINAFELTYSYKDVVKLVSFLYPTEDIPLLNRKYIILSDGIAFWDRSAVG